MEEGGGDGKKKEEFVLKLFSPFDIVSLYLVRLSYFYFSPYREQPVLDIFLRRVLARTSYLSMWKHPRDERGRKNIKGGRMENGMKGKEKAAKERERERRGTRAGKKNDEYREKQEGTSLLERPKHLRVGRVESRLRGRRRDSPARKLEKSI